MKNSKKIIAIIISVIVLFVCVLTVGIYYTVKNAGNYQSSIYDNNSKIVSQGDSYYYHLSRSNNINNKLSTSFEKFTGMDTIYKIKAKESGKITIDYDAKIKQGKFKLVLIGPNKEVSTLFENTKKGNFKIPVKKGHTRLKMVGKNTKGKLKISIETKDNIKIHYVK